MNRRGFLASAALAATASPLLAEPKEKVKIVSSLPRTGSAQAQTDSIVNAIRMAMDDFAKDVPFDVEHLDWDDATAKLGTWQAEKEADNAKNAIAEKDVMAVIGPYNSGAARVSMPILNDAGLVQVSPSSSWPGLTKKGPTSDPDEPEMYRPSKKITFCRTCPHDGNQGPLSAEFAATELKVNSVYILDDKELYGNGVAIAFKKSCEALKIKVLGHESLDPSQRDFKKLLEKIKEKGPDLVYFGGTTQSHPPRFAAAMNDAEIGCPIMVPDGCYEQAFIEGVGKETFDTLKCFVTISGITPKHLKDRGADFAERYRKKYRMEPQFYVVFAYEAAAVVMDALRTVGKKDREAIRKAVVGTKDFDKGVLGKWSFDADGDISLQPMTVATIENGVFKAVKLMGMN